MDWRLSVGGRQKPSDRHHPQRNAPSGLSQSGGSEPVILLVFGAIGLALALADWHDWRAGPITGKARIARHLSRMMAGSIATITVAVFVNLKFLPMLVLWLGPSVLITPIIFWWMARLRRGTAPTQARL